MHHYGSPTSHHISDMSSPSRCAEDPVLNNLGLSLRAIESTQGKQAVENFIGIVAKLKERSAPQSTRVAIANALLVWFGIVDIDSKVKIISRYANEILDIIKYTLLSADDSPMGTSYANGEQMIALHLSHLMRRYCQEQGHFSLETSQYIVYILRDVLFANVSICELGTSREPSNAAAARGESIRALLRCLPRTDISQCFSQPNEVIDMLFAYLENKSRVSKDILHECLELLTILLTKLPKQCVTYLDRLLTLLESHIPFSNELCFLVDFGCGQLNLDSVQTIMVGHYPGLLQSVGFHRSVKYLYPMLEHSSERINQRIVDALLTQLNSDIVSSTNSNSRGTGLTISEHSNSNNCESNIDEIANILLIIAFDRPQLFHRKLDPQTCESLAKHSSLLLVCLIKLLVLVGKSSVNETYASINLIINHICKKGHIKYANEAYIVLEALDILKDHCVKGDIFREDTMAMLRSLSTHNRSAFTNLERFNQGKPFRYAKQSAESNNFRERLGELLRASVKEDQVLGRDYVSVSQVASNKSKSKDSIDLTNFEDKPDFKLGHDSSSDITTSLNGSSPHKGNVPSTDNKSSSRSLSGMFSKSPTSTVPSEEKGTLRRSYSLFATSTKKDAKDTSKSSGNKSENLTFEHFLAKIEANEQNNSGTSNSDSFGASGGLGIMAPLNFTSSVPGDISLSNSVPNAANIGYTTANSTDIDSPTPFFPSGDYLSPLDFAGAGTSMKVAEKSLDEIMKEIQQQSFTVGNNGSNADSSAPKKALSKGMSFLSFSRSKGN